ncbi:MAG TPA: hypothetical protein IAC62_16975 [Candidatus Pelethocola excrementipullorum]|nr:hypothetical protein [Candidatus Pelethocola excrementipullorum]
MYQPKLRKQRNGIPVMRNSEIDAHAEEFLRDYNPSLLKIPQPVDIEAFAEFYLDLALDYAYLSHCGLILGRMVFQETERVPVYLPKEKCADYLYVSRGTMLIDNTVLDDRKEYRLRSTIGHECGHWLFHSDYYTFKNRGNYHRKALLPEITGCKNTDIDGGADITGRKKLITDFDWLEHHAKYFSAAVLMPKTPLISMVSDLTGNGRLNEVELTEKLSDIFQVSPISVKIRLSQLGFNKDVLGNERTQNEKTFRILMQIPGTL